MKNYPLTNTIYKKISLILLGLLIVSHFIQQFVKLSTSVQFFMMPMVWLGVVLVMHYYVPKVHSQGKIRFKGKVYGWAFNTAVCFITVSIVCGLIQGFGNSPYAHTLSAIGINVLYVGGTLIARECIRAYTVNSFSSKAKIKMIIPLVIIMTLTNLDHITISKVINLEEFVKLLGETILPEICSNVLATYLVAYGGSIASIIYLGSIASYEWLMPILPNLNWLTKGGIGIIIPVVATISIINHYDLLSKRVKVTHQEIQSIMQWLPVTMFSIFLIWFTVGVFPIYPSAIATGSMEPLIKPGDVTLLQKVNKIEQIDALQVGEIIQFKRENILITHRIMEIVEKDGIKQYKTKGDNNSVEDQSLVRPEDVKGIYRYVIPKIGWPTLMFKTKNEEITKEVKF